MAHDILSAAEACNPDMHFDAIVAYPHSSNVDITSGHISARLSVMSEMSLVAAGLVWQQHSESRLILPGETCFEDTNLPDTTDLMVAYLDDGPESIVPLHRTANGRFLNNTYLQTQGVMDWFAEQNQNPGNVLIETLDYHMERVRRTAKAYGLQADYVIAEDVLHHHDIADYDATLPVIAAGTKKTEALAYMLTIGDRKGTVLNRLMGKAGARLVDVVEDHSGSLKFENTLAKNKLTTLQRQLATASPA